MGIFHNIGLGRKKAVPANAGPPRAGTPARAQARPPGAPPGPAARPKGRPPGAAPPGAPKQRGKGRGKGRAVQPKSKERVTPAAAPLHDRRRRLVAAREATLRDLGGLMLEMYKRNRFREELLLDKCEEVLAVEVEIAHIDQRLFQLAPPNAAGMRPIGRCECGAPIHPGQNFCGVCGRGFGTLTQSRNCDRCGTGLRPGDQFCATCGTEAPDVLQALEAPAPNAPSAQRARAAEASSIAASAVAETVVFEAPSFSPAPPPLDIATDTPPLTDAPEPPSSHEPAPDGQIDAQSNSHDEPQASDTAPASRMPTASWETTAGTIETPSPVRTFDWEPASPATSSDPEEPTESSSDEVLGEGTQLPPPPPLDVDATDAAIDVALDAAQAPRTGPTSPTGRDPSDIAANAIEAALEAAPRQPSSASQPSESSEPRPATPGDAATPRTTDAEAPSTKASRAEAKRRAKQRAALQRQRAKEAKARAKLKAKQARQAKKRGGHGP